MRLTLRRIGAVLLFVYLLLTCYSSYSLFYDRIRGFLLGSKDYLRNASIVHYREKLNNFKNGPKPIVGPAEVSKRSIAERLSPPKWPQPSPRDVVVEVWGKAAIGLFLWEHVLKGTLEERLGGIWSYGAKKLGTLKFRFRTGAGVIPEKVPRDVENLILVLNGREPAKRDYAKMWLDVVAKFPSTLRNVGIVLLGREDCDNDWILPYVAPNGGRLKFAFLVYDAPIIDDDTFFQWPLGVATYRHFPRQCLMEEGEPSARSHRTYSCNFMGTVYPNSSREELIRVLKQAPPHVQRACMIKARSEWVPGETDETLAQYVRALTRSDLTLNPAGKNPECYRYFEAMSCGSVPVVLNLTTRDGEDKKGVVADGKTLASPATSVNRCSARTLRLFRDHNAPFVWLDSWDELPGLIANELRMSPEEKTLRRRDVLRWYQDFLRTMRQKFVNVIHHKFDL